MLKTDESALSPKQVEVLHLIRDEGLTTAEAAERLSKSYNATNELVRALRSKGYLSKKAGRSGNRRTTSNGASSAPAPKPEVETPVATTNGRFGRVMTLLQDAVSEADKAEAEVKAEMAELSAKQHALAQEADGLGNLRKDIREKVEALA